MERVANGGSLGRVRFPSPRLKGGSPWDFSFSGLKTAVLRYVQQAKAGGTWDDRHAADVAASFQAVVVGELTEKALAACRAVGARVLVVGGGVIANQALRERLAQGCRAARLRLYLPPVALSTDNAAMVAGLGYQLYHRDGKTASLSLSAEPNLGMRA